MCVCLSVCVLGYGAGASGWGRHPITKILPTPLTTVCLGSSDPFYIVTYFINGSLLPGHIVFFFRQKNGLSIMNYFCNAAYIVILYYMN